MVLGIERIGAASASRTAVMLHGIMGSGRNWRTPARRIVKAHPEFSILLIDHLGHGTSPADPAASLARCAQAVEDTLDQVGCDPEIVIGHSFGGKVALSLLKDRRMRNQPTPAATWLIDSVPGSDLPAPDRELDSSDVGFVLAALTRVQAQQSSWDSRHELEQALLDEGCSKPVAMWLGTSTRKPSAAGAPAAAVELVYDLPTVQRLWEEYHHQNLWEVAQSEQDEGTVGIVTASKNCVWKDPVIMAELAKMKAPNRVVPIEAGHNVHVDNLPGLMSVLADDFQ